MSSSDFAKPSTIESYRAAQMIEWEMIGLLMMIRFIYSLRIDGALLPTPPNARLKDFITMVSCVGHSSGAAGTALSGRSRSKGLVPFVSVRPMRSPRETELNRHQLLLLRNVPSLAVA